MIRMLFGTFLVLICCSHSVLYAADEATSEIEETKETFPFKTIRTEEGLVFRIPEDMPIEKKGGIVAPIPFDEYIYGKIQGVKENMTAIEERLARIEAQLGMTQKTEPQETKENKPLIA